MQWQQVKELGERQYDCESLQHSLNHPKIPRNYQPISLNEPPISCTSFVLTVHCNLMGLGFWQFFHHCQICYSQSSLQKHSSKDCLTSSFHAGYGPISQKLIQWFLSNVGHSDVTSNSKESLKFIISVTHNFTRAKVSLGDITKNVTPSCYWTEIKL